MDNLGGSDSVRRYLDDIPSVRKQTGVSAEFEITAYPDGHAAVGAHPLNGHDALLGSVSYLWNRLQREAEDARDDGVA